MAHMHSGKLLRFRNFYDDPETGAADTSLRLLDKLEGSKREPKGSR